MATRQQRMATSKNKLRPFFDAKGECPEVARMVIHSEMQKIVNDIFYEIIQRVSNEIEREIETKGQTPLTWSKHSSMVRSKIAGGILKSIAFAQDTDDRQP